MTDEQWLLIALWGACVLGVGIASLVTLLRAARDTRAERNAVEHLARIEQSLAQLATREEGLDIRRLEHVLLDIRDGQKRVEERLLASLESRGAAQITPGAQEASPSKVSERIVTRLIALGFERIEILTSEAELERALVGSAEISVEARRGGTVHKGHVVLDEGAIADVHMRSILGAFP